MKNKILVLIAIMLNVFISFNISYGDANITEQDIKAGVEFCKQYPVRLFLDDKELFSKDKETPPIIIKDYTLIPARSLFEAMGSTVEWNNEKQQVSIKYKEKEIILTIGSETALVNGTEKNLQVPALIIDHDGDYYGSTMIPVRFTAEEMGCEVKWYDPTRSVIVVPPKEENIPEWLAVYITDAEINKDFSKGTVIKPANPDTQPLPKPVYPELRHSDPWQYDMLNEAAKDKLIFIDIGHGGKDTGAIGHKGKPDELTEREANFPIGIKFYENLKKAGAKVALSRDTEIYYTLKERAGMANEAGATVFISIHNNSNTSPRPHGTEVIYYSKVNEEGKSEYDLYGIGSKEIAQSIQKQMVEHLGTYDRGVRSSPGLAVLNKTLMPAIVIEGAFLSNEEDFQKMKQPDYADKYAKAAAIGLIRALNQAYY